MRIPGAALLITIGLLLLWVATTGRFDKIGIAWDYLKNGGDLPDSGTSSNSGTGAPNATVSPIKGVLSPEVLHGNVMALTLQPEVAMFHPGGLT